MELNDAIKRLSALAQDSRLQVFTLLVKAGPDGIAAGDIARAVKILPATLSTHLLVLSNAGLIGARRQGRSLFYSVRYAAMRELLEFLTEDCCGGHPEMCATPLNDDGSCRSTSGDLHEALARTHRSR